MPAFNPSKDASYRRKSGRQVRRLSDAAFGGPTFPARIEGQCPTCIGKIYLGSIIARVGGEYVHARCESLTKTKQRPPRTPRDTTAARA